MRLSQPIVQCGNIQTDKNARRRSHSATRSFTDSTVNFMGRIGQSLRIASSSTNRRRQQNKQEKSSEEPQQEVEENQQLPPEGTSGRRQSLAEQWFRTVRNRRRGVRGIAGTQSEELSRKNFIDQSQPRPHNLLIGQEKLNQEKLNNKQVITPAGEEDDEEIKILTSQNHLHPNTMFDNNGNNIIRSSSPLSSSSAGFGCPAAVSRSCPPTPRPAMRQRYLKEGYCQLTSIQTLSQHNRYMFLFDDVLLICKEKGDNSCYKLKEKVSLEFLWLSSNNCTNSFLLGWPTTRNYIAHFNTEREKVDWFDKLNAAIQRRLRPKSTTIGVFVQIEGRQQQIRREVKNGQRAEDLIEALRIELHLPIIDPHLGHYELCFFPGSRRNSGGGRHLSGFLPSNNNNFVETKLPQSASITPTNILINENLTKENNNSSLSSSPAVLRRVKSHTSIITTPLQAAHRSPVYNCNLYNSAAIQPLHGVENVYAVLMEFVRSQLGISLSDSQLAHLDTCPLVNCKLLLRQTGPNNSPSHSSGHHNKRAALNLVNQFRRVVLGRTDSATSSGCNSPTTNPPPFGIDPNNGKKLKTPNKKQRLFGRQLRGTMPPQPVLTMIDHLLLYGADAEGIFRKSPKQQTVRLLRQQLDMGQVPDFHQFNIHVTASLLKDYLRSIPGQLLLSGNYRLWADVANMSPPLNSSPKSSPSENEKQNFLLHQDRVQRCRKLLALLPPAHTVLLRSVLRLLRKVAQNEAETRMGVSALSVCIAPSLLEKLEQVESVRIIPQLVIFLIEYAHELFDGFLEDGPLLPTTNNNSTNIENNHNHPQSNNQNIPSVPSSSPLHQSTDSGLADVGSAFNVRNAAMGTKRRFILSEHPTSNSQQQKILSQQNPQNQQNQRSVSPDSGKMSSEPLSEDDSDYWRRQQRNNRQIRNSWMLKTHSLDEGGKDNQVINNGGPLGFGIVAPHIDDDIDDDLDDPDEDDDVDLIDSLSSITIRNHYNQFQQEEDSKTPIALSRENSDAKDFRNSNSATTSIIKNNLKNNENNDNKYNINNVEINNNSILTSAASPNFAWRSKHLQQQQKQTYNQHKQRQLNGIRTQQSTNNLIQPLSPTESATPRKVSSTSSIGCNGSEQSYNTNSSNGMSGTAALSRRALIATKSEALLGLNEDERKEEIFNGTRLNLSSNNSPSSQICSPHRVASKGATSQQSSPKMAKAHLQRAIPLNGSALVLNNSSINSSNLSSVNSSLNSSSSPPNPSMLRQRLPVHLETKRQHSTGTLLMMMNNKNLNEKDDISSQPNKKEYCSSLNSSEANNLRRSSASANIEAEGALNGRKLEEEKKHFQLNQNRRPLVQRQQPQQKYIPPRRTAEELLLDKLEVNWSVPQIRKQFQQRDTANEPASAPVIDTLYVKFPGGQQQRQINKKQLV